MNLRLSPAIFLVWICHSFLLSQEEVTVVLYPDQLKDTISRHIYGHFSEHLGRCIYDGLYIGEENKVIANTAGIRNDIVEALKELKIPNLRWPGGCFADTYHWKDGVGPKAGRPTIVNRWWGGTVEDNSFGTHDFLNLCELLGTEPYISANVGSGTVQEMIDWVQYVNHDKASPMADWRIANGRLEPWKVKYWGIGNETWGCGGNMRAEYYADLYRQYATFIAGWSGDLEITRIASGASGGNYHWTETLMKNVPHHLMEAVALHHYSVFDWGNKGPSVRYDEEIYFRSMEQALQMDELVRGHVEIMDKYDPVNRVALYVDEWGGWYDTEEEMAQGVLFQQSTMRDAMIAATTLNTFNNHARRVKMANIAQVVNVLQAVILTSGEKILLTPTYHVMHMYRVHQDAVLIPSDIRNNASYTNRDKSLPVISVSASKSSDQTIHISLANIHPERSLPVRVNLNGIPLNSEKIQATILTSPKLQDHNTFDHIDKVKPTTFSDFTSREGEILVTIPPFSVIMLDL